MDRTNILDEHNKKDNLLVDLLKYAPSVLLPRLTGLITVPIVTRLFAPEIYGKYALAIAVISLLSAMSSGFGAALIRFLPANEGSDQDRSRFLSTLFILTGISVVIISLISFLALELVATGMQKDLIYLVEIGLISYALNVAFLIFTNFLRSRRKAGTYSILQLLQGYGSLGIGLLLVITLGMGIQGLLWGTIIATGMVSVLCSFYLYKDIYNVQFHYSGKLAKELLKFSILVSIGNVVYWVLSLSDRWMIELMRGSREVGLYDISYSITGKTMYILIGAFSLSLQPLITSIWEKEGKEKTENIIGKTTQLYLLFAVPMAVGLSVIAKPLVRLISTTEYEEGYIVVPFVALSMLLYGLSDIIGRAFVLNNRPDIETRNFFVAAMINVILNLIFIPRIGYFAAGIASCIGYVVLLSMHTWSSKKYIKWIFPWNTVRNILIASIMMTLAIFCMLYVFPNLGDLWRILLSTLVGSTIYFITLIIKKEFLFDSIKKNILKSFIKGGK